MLIENEYRVIGPPGTGKTTYLAGQVATRVDAYCRRTQNQPGTCTDVLVSSLTKAAASEVRGRDTQLPPEQVGTLHSHAYRALGNPKMCVTPAAIKQWNDEAPNHQWKLSGASISGGAIDDEIFDSTAKCHGDELMSLYGIYRSRMTPKAEWRPDVEEFAREYDHWRFRNSVMDYHDLINECFASKVKPPGNPSTILVDECFPAWTPVHLADGTHKTIQEIVDGRLTVDVLSYDTASATQKVSRVCGWSRVLNQKPLVKVKVQWLRSRGNSFVVCTSDHRIWANGAWIPAGELKVGDVLQVETEAFSTQRGKITARGRQSLLSVMTEKNKTIARGPSRGGISVRGGNGRGVTLAEQELFSRLGSGWESHYVLPTKEKRGSGYPTNYKIDIANPAKKIAVEVDGVSHAASAVAAADARKSEFLRSRGWKVMRFRNREAIQTPDACVDKILSSDCPIGAVVVSVEQASIPDSYVYDITVSETHCFYANGILVHNCQDHDMQELRLLRQWAADVNKLIIVGDPDQNLYSWRGADPGGFYGVEVPDGHTKVLEQSYRVPRAVHAAAMSLIEKAHSRVPVVYHPKDEPGDVRVSPASLTHDCGMVVDEIERIIATTDETVMVLFSCAFMASPICEQLRERGILYWNQYSPGRGRFNPFHPVNGRSMLDRLRSYLRPSRDVYGSDARMWTYSELNDWVSLCDSGDWLVRGAKTEIESHAKMYAHDPVSLEFLRRQIRNESDLRALASVSLEWLSNRISSKNMALFEVLNKASARSSAASVFQKTPRVTIGTVHSVKGGEADNVFVCPDLSASGWDLMGTDDGYDALIRMFYVAMTRAARSLILTRPGRRMAFDWSEAGL